MPLVSPKPGPPEYWLWLYPKLAPYLRKPVLAALKRKGVDVAGWPT